MQATATQTPVVTHVVTVDDIGALKGKALDSALTKLFFSNSKGSESHGELWQAAAHIFITVVTNGGNKAALFDQHSKRAQESSFYSHLHADKGKTIKVKALRAATEAARPYVASGAVGDELAQILSIIKTAFFGVLPQRAPTERAATDKITAAIKVLQKAREDHTLTQEHVQALLPIVETFFEVEMKD